MLCEGMGGGSGGGVGVAQGLVPHPLAPVGERGQVYRACVLSSMGSPRVSCWVSLSGGRLPFSVARRSDRPLMRGNSMKSYRRAPMAPPIIGPTQYTCGQQTSSVKTVFGSVLRLMSSVWSQALPSGWWSSWRAQRGRRTWQDSSQHRCSTSTTKYSCYSTVLLNDSYLTPMFTLSLTPMRCPMVTEKPMDRAADPRRPFLLSSVTAKMQITSCMVRKTSTVVPIPRLMPGCSWRYTCGQKHICMNERSLQNEDDYKYGVWYPWF